MGCRTCASLLCADSVPAPRRRDVNLHRVIKVSLTSSMAAVGKLCLSHSHNSAVSSNCQSGDSALFESKLDQSSKSIGPCSGVHALHPSKAWQSQPTCSSGCHRSDPRPASCTEGCPCADSSGSACSDINLHGQGSWSKTVSQSRAARGQSLGRSAASASCRSDQNLSHWARLPEPLRQLLGISC